MLNAQVAENTFGFWYRLTEDLFHVHDEALNSLFRAHAQRLIVSLHRQCQIEPDHVSYIVNDALLYFRL